MTLHTPQFCEHKKNITKTKNKSTILLLTVILTGLPIFFQPAGLAAQSAPKHTENIALIELGGKKFWVEYARSNAERSLGMMFRPTPQGDQGMLFAYPSPVKLAFWMKNTPAELTIGFFDENDALKEVKLLKPYDTKTVVSSTKGRYALEMRLGWFWEHKIKPGTKLKVLKVRKRTPADEKLISALQKGD